MPTVPSPNSSAFGGGALPRAQHNLGTAIKGFGQSMSSIARDLADRENKAKYREDAQTRSSDLQSKAKPLLTQINQKWLATGPSTREDKDVLKAQIDSALNDLLAPKVYHFKESKIEYANALGEMATSILTKAGKVVNENGIIKAKSIMEQSVGRMAEHLRRSPKAFIATLVKFKKDYERDGAALGKDGGKFFRSKVVELAEVAQHAFIELGDVEAADVITNIPYVSNMLNVKERMKLWAAADGAKNIASKDVRQTRLDNSLIKQRDQQTELTRARTKKAAFDYAGVTGSRKPTKKEAAAAYKTELEITRLEQNVEKGAKVIESLKNSGAAKLKEEEKKLMQKLIPKTQQLIAKHQPALNNGEFTQERARTLLNAAVEYMTKQRPRPGVIPTPPPGYATALQNMGININSYVTGSAVAVQDAEEAISKLPSITGDVERVTANLSATADQQAPDSAGQDPALASAGQDPALASSIGDPTPANDVDDQQQETGAETTKAQEHQNTAQVIPELSSITEHVFEKANTVENDETGQAITSLKNISDTGMTVHNLLDLTHGFTNTLLRTAYEFSPTAVFIPDQNDKALATQRLKSAVRLLVFAAERKGRFTDKYRDWLLVEFDALKPSMFKNPDAARVAVEGIASSLAERAVLYAETIEKVKAGGDPNLSPRAGQIATERFKEIKQMIKTLGAPLPMTNYTTDELSSEQLEAAQERARNYVKLGILEPGDKVSIGGRIATVSGDE